MPSEHNDRNILTELLSPPPTPTPDAEKERISQLELQVDNLNGQIELMSVELKNYQLQREKVIKSINANLGGRFKGKAEYIYNVCVINQVRPELMASIFKHETGNGQHFAAKNNPGGVRFPNSYKFRPFDSIEEGIRENVLLIKREYIDRGRKDIVSIGRIYCPTNDKSDVKGLNKSWIPTVTQFYKKILKDAGGSA
jgi:hypothetical protein